MARQTGPNAFALLGFLGFSGFLVAGDCKMDETDSALLDRVNEARSQPRQCGNENFDAAKPLSWNCKLEDAALAHSEDMVEQEYFSHTGPDGVQVGERVRSRSYSWSAVGENIARGQNSVDDVVDGWLSSPGHCANIMSTKFTEMGAARVEVPGSPYSPYWAHAKNRSVPVSARGAIFRRLCLPFSDACAYHFLVLAKQRNKGLHRKGF